MNTAAADTNMLEEEADVCIAAFVLTLLTAETWACVMEGAAGVAGTLDVADGIADELTAVLLRGKVVLASL